MDFQKQIVTLRAFQLYFFIYLNNIRKLNKVIMFRYYSHDFDDHKILNETSHRPQLVNIIYSLLNILAIIYCICKAVTVTFGAIRFREKLFISSRELAANLSEIQLVFLNFSHRKQFVFILNSLLFYVRHKLHKHFVYVFTPF